MISVEISNAGSNDSKKNGKDQQSIQQAPRLTQDTCTNGKVTTSQLDITNDALFIRARVVGKLVELSFRKSVIMAVWSVLLGAVVIKWSRGKSRGRSRGSLKPPSAPCF